MRYRLDTLQSELLYAVRKSIRIGYSDGARLYARMLTRFVLSGDFAPEETDIMWLMSLKGQKRDMTLHLMRALTGAGHSQAKALATVRALVSE